MGKRHYEVARLLKDIKKNTTFTLRLIEPMKSGFQGIGPRNGSKSNGKKGYGTGKETLRFKANGNAAVEEQVRRHHSHDIHCDKNTGFVHVRACILHSRPKQCLGAVEFLLFRFAQCLSAQPWPISLYSFAAPFCSLPLSFSVSNTRSDSENFAVGSHQIA